MSNTPLDKKIEEKLHFLLDKIDPDEPGQWQNAARAVKELAGAYSEFRGTGGGEQGLGKLVTDALKKGQLQVNSTDELIARKLPDQETNNEND